MTACVSCVYDVCMELVRLSVNMNTETAEALRTLAARDGVSLTEEIRRCVAITAYLSDQRLEGRQIITENRDGSHRKEMVIL